MVDFKKKLHKSISQVKVHPCEIYESLDRESDKGPLRSVQLEILNNWFENFKSQRDVILKLHTGQGKTIIGLLILQSRINQKSGPAIYLCPNNYLVEQTFKQADSFGIKYSKIEDDLPDDFIEGNSVLITTASKLFNGLTKFGLGSKSLEVATVVLDDSHSCIEVIKSSCKINIPRERQVYFDLLTLFGPELEKQGAGTFADIKKGDYDSFICVPYWDWHDKSTEVVSILANYNDLKEIKFAWPLIKDNLKECSCVISGTEIEITPYQPPLEMFGSYFKAEHRIFMSATVNDDSFFINGLGVNSSVVKNPLHLKNEKWSGEKMILIPSLIDPVLNYQEVVSLFARPSDKRIFGVVALTPSFNRSKDWEAYGSTVANKNNIIEEIEKLKNKQFKNPLVIVNRYDGIDLPDNSCRILVFSSSPHAESLQERYLESCRSNSDITAIKLAQTVEQGFGRGVRGEKDYCAIVIIGPELIKLLKSKKSQGFFSSQTKAQIQIGLEIAEYAKEDVRNGESASKALLKLISQQLLRDEGWKDFYTDKMNTISTSSEKEKVFAIFEAEKKANEKYRQGDYSGATAVLQKLIDTNITDDEEKGWYLQEMARIIYPQSPANSNQLQVTAHKKNKYLFKPKEGLKISRLTTLSIKRIENVKNWIQAQENYEELKINIDSVLSLLRLGVNPDRFEGALEELGSILGFVSQRPDKEFNEGPDNLWKLKDDQYLLIECKNRVDPNRDSINKDESGQINNSSAWFSRTHGDVPVKRIMIIPTKKVSSAAGFNVDVEIMREKNLKKLVTRIDEFFKEFQYLDLKDLSHQKIQELLNLHKLDVPSILGDYSEAPRVF